MFIIFNAAKIERYPAKKCLSNVFLPHIVFFRELHKKSVELIPCLNVRVSTPHQSNKSFHAVLLRHL